MFNSSWFCENCTISDNDDRPSDDETIEENTEDADGACEVDLKSCNPLEETKYAENVQKDEQTSHSNGPREAEDSKDIKEAAKSEMFDVEIKTKLKEINDSKANENKKDNEQINDAIDTPKKKNGETFFVSKKDRAPLKDPSEWTVDEVEEFIREIGFPEQAHLFKEQEIDGRSLLLLKRVDVLTGLPMKLGPALKIYAHIFRLQGTKMEFVSPFDDSLMIDKKKSSEAISITLNSQSLISHT
ncbi:sterile alpha motif domain-containing protein 13-like protein [Dinothrombium tinctorium]|uniref:Sterile alpha motif domain-containing protein 13-like protein n=1 Tax=Dinothrombium tinctorium TaxID=1965070 RepID=A0A3S3PU55_9ACAR|nr:sterile alpha motif domain-containing protein 13-like protein [Dinothrombium tinctorium]